MKSTEFLIIIILIISTFVFIKINRGDVVYIKSDIDKKSYLVRNVIDKQKVSNLLARINQNIDTIVQFLVDNKHKYNKYKKYIEQLEYRINGVIINESSASSSYTSYSVNKGEQLVFCVRSKTTNEIHSLNLMMYVALHELSHIACPEYGHTKLFKKIFKFITQIGINIGIYEKIDFNNNSAEYCGIYITDSIV
jgi:hypothetical protein